MSIIVGSDGAAQINLGTGVKYVANIFSWDASMKREMLRRTTQADEAERRTGGLADWTGSFSFRLQFSDDVTTALSAWQLLDFAFNEIGDDLKAELQLTLQSYKTPPDFEIFQTTVSGVVKLTGTVVIGDIRLDCTDPEQPIVAVANWSGDGALTLVRA